MARLAMFTDLEVLILWINCGIIGGFMPLFMDYHYKVEVEERIPSRMLWLTMISGPFGVAFWVIWIVVIHVISAYRGRQ